jgi:protocatechuate 4,5-dioxygenase alpha chain
MGTAARRPHGDGRDYNDSIFLGLAANVRVALVTDGLCCQAPLRYICQVNTRIGVEAMARKAQDYDDIPGTFVFDAERSRQGYGINMFCMSLMKEDNRKAFKADELQYLKKFKLTPEQADAILKRDYNRMLELGGNIYFTAKLGATDGHSFRHLAATMTGATQDDYADMMLKGGRSVEGNRSRSGLDNTVRPTSRAKSKSKSKPKAKSNTRSKSRSRRG